MKSRKLQTLPSRITQAVLLIALVNSFLIFLILAIVRPALNDHLTQGYLNSLGRYVKEDIRYTLLVQDTTATREYVNSIRQFPWIQGISLHDADGNKIAHNGSTNWTPSVDEYASRIHTFGSTSHLLEIIMAASAEDASMDTIGYFHIEVDSSGLTSPVNWAFMIVVAILIAGSLCFWYLTSSIAMRTTQSISAINDYLNQVDPDNAMPEFLALNPDTIEIDNVQRGINSLVQRVGSFKDTVEGEVRERTRELANALDKNRKSEAIRRSLTMNLSHELKTPLTASLGYINHAMESLQDGSEDLLFIQSLLERSRHSLIVLSEEIRTLLQYSASGETDEPIEFTRIDVSEVVALSVSSSSELTASSGNTIVTDHTGRQHFHTSRELLRCILHNLMTNSHRACKNGTITVSTNIDDTGWLTLIVHDTGAGIPRDEREHIFEKHFSGSAAPHIGPRGMGIGLSMVRFWIDLLDGNIDVESTEGEYTRLTVHIPESQNTASSVSYKRQRSSRLISSHA
jgi:signal transduction histidine kinase